MEQEDSLRAELQNLSYIQSEQLKVLQDMKSRQSMDSSIQQARDINFNTQQSYTQSISSYPGSSAPVNFGPTDTNALFLNNQSMTYAANTQYASQNVGLIKTISPTTQANLQDRTLANMTYGTRLSTAAVALGGAVGQTGLTTMAISGLPFLAGLGVSMGVGALAGLYTDAAIDEINKNGSLKKYIYANSNKFINSSESNNTRRLGGFSREETQSAANFVRRLNDDFYMKDEDMMNLLQKYTEGGLLKDATDLKSFKEKMKTLTKSVKEGALMLNETYEGIAELMAEMKKAGIDQNDFSNFMGMGNVIGNLTGQSGTSVIQGAIGYVQNNNAGTGNDSDYTLSRYEETAVYLANYFNDLENKNQNGKLNFQENSNYNMITNLGGSVEAAKQLNTSMESLVSSKYFTQPALAFFDYNDAAGEFQFDKKMFKKFLNSDISLQDAYGIAQNKLQTLVSNGNSAAVNKWNQQSGLYIKNNMGDGNISELVGKVLDMYSNDSQMQAAGFTTRSDILGMMGISDPNLQNLLSGFLDYRTANPGLMGKATLQSIWSQQISNKLANAPSLSERFKAWGDNVKDGATQWLVDIDNAIGNKFEDFSNWINGTSKLPQRYDQIFSTSSRADSMQIQDVIKAMDQAREVVASGTEAVKELSKKGYDIDKDLLKFVEVQEKNIDKSVEYKRDKIVNWDEVKDDLSESKNEIISQAEKNKLSETIVAALTQYSRENKDEKIDVSSTVKKLGEENYNYGGNTKLALAATLSSQDSVDKALKGLGYDMGILRKVGAQELVSDLDYTKLGLSDNLITKVEEIFNQSIGKSINGDSDSPYFNPSDVASMSYHDLRSKSDVTAEDLDKIIAEKSSNQAMQGAGKYFIEAGEQNGVDPLYLFAHSAHETGFWSSNIMNSKNNFYGIGAYDSSPYASAYSFNNIEQGIKGGAKWISEKYINSSRFEQNTLYSMNHDSKEGWHNYATDAGWGDKIANIMLEVLNQTNKGYTENGTNNVTTMEVDVTDKDTDKTGAFSRNKNQNRTERLDKFLKDNEVFYADSDTGSEKVKIQVSNRAGLGDLDAWITKDQKEIYDILATKDKSYRSLDASKDAYHIMKQVEEELANQTISANEVSDRVNALLSSKRSKKIMGDNLDSISELISSKLLLKNNDSDNNGNYYDALKNFGEIFLDVNEEDFGNDISGYNQELYNKANQFYMQKKNQLFDFAVGKKSDAAKAWDTMDASEQEATYRTLQKLEESLGKTGSDRVSSFMNGDREKYVLSSPDREKLKYLHTDKNGHIYYDATREETGNTLETYSKWRSQGESTFSTEMIKNILNIEGDKTLSNKELLDVATKQLKDVKTDQYNAVKEYNEFFKNNKESIVKAVTKEGEPYADKYRKQLIDALTSGNQSGVDAAIKAIQGNGNVSVDINAVEKLKVLYEKMSDVDVTGFINVINGIEEIGNLAVDTGKTSMLLQNQMGEVFNVDFEQNLTQLLDAIYSSNEELKEKLGDEHSNLSDIINLLSSGGTIKDEKGNIVLEVSSEDLQSLTQATSNAMTDALTEALSTKEGALQFQSSELFKNLASDDNGIVINLGDKQYDLNSAMEEIINGEGENRNKLIQEVVDSFSQNVKDLGDSANSTGDAINDLSDALTKSSSKLSRAITTYDSNISTAIATLNGRVNKISATGLTNGSSNGAGVPNTTGSNAGAGLMTGLQIALSRGRLTP